MNISGFISVTQWQASALLGAMLYRWRDYAWH
jgi:hypothetical protein